MLVWLLVLAGLGVLLLGAGALLLARRTDVRSRTLSEPVERVEVDLPAGGVRVTAAGGGDGVRLVRATRWSLGRPEASETVAGGVLRIVVRRPRAALVQGLVEYELEVPAATAVRASTGAGSIWVGGVGGALDLRTSAGRLTVSGASGPLRLASSAGAVEGLELRSRQVEAVSSAGGVRLDFAAPPERVEARTSAGSVDVALPQERYRVEAASGAGRTEVDVPVDPAAPRSILARSSAGPVRVRRR
jgi:hypothetical protein